MCGEYLLVHYCGKKNSDIFKKLGLFLSENDELLIKTILGSNTAPGY